MKTMSVFVAAVAFVFFTAALVRAEVRFTPRLSAGVEYTDNFWLATDDPGDEAESERITTVSPGFTLEFEERTASLALSYDPASINHKEHDELDFWRHAASATGEWQAGRQLRLLVQNDYLHSEDLVDEDDLTIRRSRSPYARNTATARAEYQYGAEDLFFVEGLHTFLENDDVAIEDSQRYGGGAGVTHWFDVRWGVELSAQAFHVAFDQQTEDYDDYRARLRFNHRFDSRLLGYFGYQHTLFRFDDAADDSDIYDGFAGFEYAIDPTMDLGVEAHYFVRELDGGGSESGAPVNVNFVKRFQRGSLELAGEGGYNRTSVSAEDLGYFVFYTGSILGNYDFSRRINGDIDAAYTYRDYKDVTPSRKEDVVRAGCGLSIQLASWLSARLGYTFRAIDSTVETNDYQEHRGSLFFTITPPQPWRL